MSDELQPLAEMRGLLLQMRDMVEGLRHDCDAHRLAMHSVFAVEDFLFAMERDGIVRQNPNQIKRDRPPVGC